MPDYNHYDFVGVTPIHNVFEARLFEICAVVDMNDSMTWLSSEMEKIARATIQYSITYFTVSIVTL